MAQFLGFFQIADITLGKSRNVSEAKIAKVHLFFAFEVRNIDMVKFSLLRRLIVINVFPNCLPLVSLRVKFIIGVLKGSNGKL